MVKNEADIIEPMIRHNLRYLDSLVVIDNSSNDQTQATIKAMCTEYPDRLFLRQDSSVGYPQQQILNDLITDLASDNGIVCFVPLDADELIRADRDLFRETLLNEERPIRFPWVTFVPTPDDEPGQENPVRRITHRRCEEPKQRYKTTFPTALVGKAELKPGSHGLIPKNRPGKGVRGLFSRKRKRKLDLKPRTVEGLSLAHYPVRSKEQLLAKVVIGALNMRLRTGGKTAEGFQWHELAQSIMERRGMTDEEFYYTAKHYADAPPISLVHDPLTMEQADLILRYPAEDPAQLSFKLMGFASDCVDAFRSYQQSGKQGAASRL